MEWYTQRTNEFVPKKGTIWIGNTSSNHHFFRGVNITNPKFWGISLASWGLKGPVRLANFDQNPTHIYIYTSDVCTSCNCVHHDHTSYSLSISSASVSFFRISVCKFPHASLAVVPLNLHNWYQGKVDSVKLVKVLQNVNLQNPEAIGDNYCTSWWFQPIWKILVKLDHFTK